MRNKRMIIMCLTAIMLIITSLLYVSYGYYMTSITGIDSSKKLTSLTKIFKFEFSDGSEKLVSNNTNFIPGSVLEKTFTIKNKSTEGVYFNIDLDEVINTFNRTNDIIYEVYYNDKIISTNTFPTIDSSIATNLYIEKDETKTYTLKVKYLNSEENQISDMGKSIGANIVFSRTDSPKTKFNILGNSYQGVTGGKNLFNPTSWSDEVTQSGLTIKYLVDEDCFLINGTSTTTTIFAAKYINLETDSTKKYSISTKYLSGTIDKSNSTTTSKTAVLYFGNSDTINTTNNWKAINLQENDNKLENLTNNLKYITRVWFYVNDNITFDNYKIKVQLEEGSTATNYEKYGKTTSLEIVSLGSKVTNESDSNYGKYQINMEGKSKNLINNVQSTQTLDNLNIVVNEDKTITIDGENSSNSTIALPITNIGGTMRTFTLPENTTFTLSGNVTMPSGTYLQLYGNKDGTTVYITYKNTPVTFTTSEESMWGAYLRIDSGSTFDNVTIKPQLEVGSIATDYVPYSTVNYSLYFNEPLRCVDSICDYVDLINKKLVRRIKEITFNGTENWLIMSERAMQYDLSDDYPNSVDYVLAKSNYYDGYSWNDVYNGKIGVARSRTAIRIRPNSTLLTVDEWKNELVTLYNNGNPLVVNYVTPNEDTSEQIPLPDISIFKDRTLVVTDGNLYSSKIEIE